MAGVNENNLIAYYANGHYYAFSTFGAGQKYEATMAESAAVIIHGSAGYLANVTSSGENEFIWSNTNNGGKIVYANDRGAWLGATDSDKHDRGFHETEGKFVWQGGPEKDTEISYTNWGNNEPNNNGKGNNEDFLELLPGGKWNDIKGGTDSGVRAILLNGE